MKCIVQQYFILFPPPLSFSTMRRKDSAPASLWLQGLVRESLTVLCRNALPYDRRIEVQGLLCITVDEDNVIVVNVNELLTKQSQVGVGVFVGVGVV